MPGDVDKSLLDRLAALRGASAPPERATKISIDTIERAKTPTREDTLAARLKSLRDSPSPSSTRATPGSSTPSKHHLQASSSHSVPSHSDASTPSKNAKTREKYGGGEEEEGEDVDAVFRTDDRMLEELVGDMADVALPSVERGEGEGEDGKEEERVRRLLEELSIPKDQDGETKDKDDWKGEDEKDETDDDSDGEKMMSEADKVIARLRDEIEVEKHLSKKDEEEEEEEEGLPTFSDTNLSLPSVPQDLSAPTSSQPPTSSTDITDITARLSALRTSSAEPSLLPSVPTSQPTKENPNRLKSTTNYTDDDADSWCTVCLEDATLRCLGCADDEGEDEDGRKKGNGGGEPYCTRCWREMHVGPAAAFDDRTHKAVQFDGRQGKVKKEKKRVALGA